MPKQAVPQAPTALPKAGVKRAARNDSNSDVLRISVVQNGSMKSQDDAPRSMRDPAVRERRLAMLQAPHIAPLTAYAAKLRRGSLEVPQFDPFDGGVEAQVLFLFEKPGPKTSREGGSGFISRNNDDPSAEATFQFMQAAGLPRELTVTWNVIPWWNGTRKVTTQELQEGVRCVEDLVTLLPKLKVVVLVGRKAARAERYLTGKQLTVFTSAHPSPLVRASNPEKWTSIPSEWSQASAALRS